MSLKVERGTSSVTAPLALIIDMAPPWDPLHDALHRLKEKGQRLSNKLHKNLSASHATFPFLRLPRELRDRVYKELLTRPDHDELWIRFSPRNEVWWDATRYCRCRGKREQLWATLLSLEILQTNKQVYAEAMRVLYGRNKVWIDAPPSRVIEFLTRLSPVGRESIRFLRLWLDSRIIEAERLMFTFSQLSESTQAQRIEQELLIPWQNLLPYIATHLSNLQTLRITKNAARPDFSWFAEPKNQGWAQFYLQGWVEKARDTIHHIIPQLEIEMRVNFTGPQHSELEGIRELRENLSQYLPYREVSAQWTHSFFGTNGQTMVVWPCSTFLLSLACDDDKDAAAAAIDSDRVSGNDDDSMSISTLPEFRQKYTPDDGTFEGIACMEGGSPCYTPTDHYV
ncbi:hypothetical protein AJ80_04997 [Polytolypa hystricis UAMH7299]|uniref:F-box domain-containing protein n=1 Tax=Polytolypa hystricis (strain UAMH7299) TaxID=1447883 RepID=A0A2B7Y750_POLH7|nr:hypothetical protein AJ80_04997 [Polytolypa hystricis UAMH7299]